MIDKKILDEHNLTEKEYELIIELIGKEPNLTELGIFSLMWSEHCSYKSSRVHLKRLPVTGDRVIQGPGENAGVIDIGDGLAAVFKIESHNHPSFMPVRSPCWIHYVLVLLLFPETERSWRESYQVSPVMETPSGFLP